jgi:hypothetical protein
VVTAEEKFPRAEGHTNIGLRSAAVADVAGAQWRDKVESAVGGLGCCVRHCLSLACGVVLEHFITTVL